MRLSIDEQDNLTIEQIEIMRDCQILVDGKPVQAIVADEEQGYVIRHQRDQNGHLVVEGDHFKEERVDGYVEIKSPHRKTPRA